MELESNDKDGCQVTAHSESFRDGDISATEVLTTMPKPSALSSSGARACSGPEDSHITFLLSAFSTD